MSELMEGRYARSELD